jgi:hypothetical protein
MINTVVMNKLFLVVFLVFFNSCANPATTNSKSEVSIAAPETTRKQTYTAHESKEEKVADSSRFDTTFYFAIETNESGYNSKTKKFWRMYSGGVIEYHNITLKTDEMKAIYAAFKEADFTSFPTKFEPTTDTITEVEPNFYYTISSNFGGELHKVYYSDAQTDRAMRIAARPFLDLYRALYDILESNAEVKAIPESDIGWE